MKKSNFRPAKGRPSLPAEERKSIVVAVKFDIDSYQQMMDKALTAGINRSEYIRQVSVKGRVVERLSPRDIKAIRDLQGIAANINQIAKRTNETGNFYAEEMRELQQQYQKIWCSVEQILNQFS